MLLADDADLLKEDVDQTMRSVAELIDTVSDLQARKVCMILAELLRRALEENRTLKQRIALLEAEVAQLKAENAALRAENAALRAENAELRAENARLREENAWLRRQLFGDKSEALPPWEASGTPASSSSSSSSSRKPEPAPEPVDAAKLAEAKELQKKARAMMRAASGNAKKAKVSFPQINSELVRRRVPKGLVCNACQGEVKDRGMAHTASELDVVPISFIRREYLLHRGACDCGEVSFVMPGPERGLEKTTASPRLIAEVAVDKFLYHFPVYRQEAWLKDHHVDISRSTVNGWILRGAVALEPLWKAVCEANRNEAVKQIDETPVCVVTEGESKDRFLWCTLSESAVSFDVTETRTQQIAGEILGKAGDVTLTDGHGAYSKKSVPGKHAQCIAHARRKFYDALVSFPKEAFAVLCVIHSLFLVEHEADAKGLDADRRRDLRKTRSAALLNELATLVRSFNPPPRSSLGKAIKYLEKRWVGLTRFLDDGRIPLTNNAVESRFRDAKLGFKNFLFAQSEVGADAVAIYYTLIATARLRGLDPVAYLADVLQRIGAGHPASRLDELLPHNWQPPESGGDEDELPPMSREERVPVDRVVASRRLAGKVRVAAAAPDVPTAAIQKTAVS